MMPDAEVRRLADAVGGALFGNLTGLILCGSAVHGGLRPASDIDLLAVVSSPLSVATRESLTRVLLRISGRRGLDGPARPAEVTVVVCEDLRAAPLEIATEFQYGEWLRDGITRGETLKRNHNPDLVLVLAMARDGASLIGPSAKALLPSISRADVNLAISNALPELLANVEGDERNVALTVARMQVTRESGQFVPKDVAAERIACRLPPDQARMLRLSAASYRGESEDDWNVHGPALQSYLAAAAAEIG